MLWRCSGCKGTGDIGSRPTPASDAHRVVVRSRRQGSFRLETARSRVSLHHPRDRRTRSSTPSIAPPNARSTSTRSVIPFSGQQERSQLTEPHPCVAPETSGRRMPTPSNIRSLSRKVGKARRCGRATSPTRAADALGLPITAGSGTAPNPGRPVQFPHFPRSVRHAGHPSMARTRSPRNATLPRAGWRQYSRIPGATRILPTWQGQWTAPPSPSSSSVSPSPP